jgi:ketosteroid isomerase-like protein
MIGAGCGARTRRVIGDTCPAMPEANVELVRKGLEAFNRRDLPGMLQTLDPDVELLPLRAVLEGEAYHGHDGFLKWLSDMDEDWESFRAEPTELRNLDQNQVLVIGRVRAKARASGIDVDAPGAWLCSLRDLKVTRIHFYADPERALAENG